MLTSFSVSPPAAQMKTPLLLICSTCAIELFATEVTVSPKFLSFAKLSVVLRFKCPALNTGCCAERQRIKRLMHYYWNLISLLKFIF